LTIRIWVDGKSEKWLNTVVNAVKKLSKKNPDIDFIIYCNSSEVSSILSQNNRFEIKVSEEDIAMDVKVPLKACFKQKTSSMRLWLDDINSGEIDAFISSWNTWALVAWAVHSKILWTLVKWVAPALLATIPQENWTETIMLDVGANTRESVDINMHNLIMGIEYLKQVKGKQKIVIWFMTIWTEPWKWSKIDNDTISTIEKYFDINEGQDNDDLSLKRIEPDKLLNSECDIILKSWVRWNEILKTAEWVAKAFKKEIKSILKLWMIISALTLKKKLSKYSWDSWAICMWVNWIVIKTHWGSDENSFIWAGIQTIEYAKEQKKYDIIWNIQKALLEYKAWSETQSKID